MNELSAACTAFTGGNMDSLNVVNTNDYVSVSVIVDRHLASAEVSRLDNNLWYFNRLIVPSAIRNQGIATRIMEQLVKILDTEKITLACDINPYGDLDFNQLYKFYKKYGFVDDNRFNLMRHPGGNK